MIKLELSDQMVAIIGEALGNAPFKVVSPVIAEIQKQIDAQQPKTEAINATNSLGSS